MTFPPAPPSTFPSSIHPHSSSLLQGQVRSLPHSFSVNWPTQGEATHPIWSHLVLSKQASLMCHKSRLTFPSLGFLAPLSHLPAQGAGG